MSAPRPRPGLPPEHPARTPYRDDAAAGAYALRRWTTGTGPRTDARERVLLEDLLARAALPRGTPVLDLPAGAGRLAGLLAAHGLAVTCGDQSPEMLAHAAGTLRGAGLPRRVVVADALAPPFRDRAFGLVLCHRLIHHLPRPEERAALLAALARVTDRWLLLSWFDTWSVQHLRRAVRRPWRPSRRHAMTRAELERAARAAGLHPARTRALRPRWSELTFTLLERR